jgi:hypothetical protein
MPTYTITAKFHVEGEFDDTLSHEENYYNVLNFFEYGVSGHGVHLLEVTDIEED